MSAAARIGDEDVKAEQDKQKKGEKMKQDKHCINSKTFYSNHKTRRPAGV